SRVYTDGRLDFESRLYRTIMLNGMVADVYDCAAEAASPTATMMDSYDLVMWFTGSNGVGNYFWNNKDTVNTEIKSYLDNGGKFWAYGIDILYDRYGSAPDYFSPGDFIYDYFGTASYKMQSKANDGGVGLPMVVPTMHTSVTEIDTINWSYETLSYADGCDLAPHAYADLVCNGDGYIFNGLPNSYHTTGDNFITMSTWFNPYYMRDDAMRIAFTGDVINWFMNTEVTSLAVSELTAPAPAIELVLNEMEDEFIFDWTEVTSDEALIYNLMLNTNAEGRNTFVITTEKDSVVVSAADIFALTGSKSDTLELNWSITALTPNAGISASASQTHVLKELINESPMVFNLYAPANNDTLDVLAVTDVTFSWSPSFDPDADKVSYELILAAMGDTLISMTTEDTTITVLASVISEIIGDNPLFISGWKVVVSDGEYTAESLTNILYVMNDIVGIDEVLLPMEFALYNN
ncbi:MAG: hypothetical protein KAI81_02400, partial [Candidatus Marinimicrobia bacterium]|nr:hypothetical protein [Candidatus Neomarinimicrobiota bacterium]